MDVIRAAKEKVFSARMEIDLKARAHLDVKRNFLRVRGDQPILEAGVIAARGFLRTHGDRPL